MKRSMGYLVSAMVLTSAFCSAGLADGEIDQMLNAGMTIHGEFPGASFKEKCAQVDSSSAETASLKRTWKENALDGRPFPIIFTVRRDGKEGYEDPMDFTYGKSAAFTFTAAVQHHYPKYNPDTEHGKILSDKLNEMIPRGVNFSVRKISQKTLNDLVEVMFYENIFDGESTRTMGHKGIGVTFDEALQDAVQSKWSWHR